MNATPGTRRHFLAALATLATAAGLPAVYAQKPARAKMARVGIISIASPQRTTEQVFMGTMHELGWVEGRDIAYERRYAQNEPARLAELAAELVALRPDLLHVQDDSSVAAVLAHTRVIPVVFGAVNNPVGRGFVQSMARPGGNVTGIVNVGWELGGRRMQLLKELMPRLARVGVLVGATPSGASEQRLIAEAAGPAVQIVPAVVKGLPELPAALQSLAAARPEAVLTTHNGLFLRDSESIVAMASKLAIPLVAHRDGIVARGALMSYSSNLHDQYRRAAQLAHKILTGAKPAEIPVEQPTRFDVVVDLRTAKTLGITIPQSILLQASRVIE